MTTRDDFLAIGPRIRCLPIIHGSADCAERVRDDLLDRGFDCLAVPLPPSFQDDVEAAVARLPRVSVVAQLDADPADSVEEVGFNYVPIDPCQPVIAALRLALGEHVPRAYVDLETPRFEPQTAVLPDPYALKRISLAAFAAAVLPALEPPLADSQHERRIRWTAARLRELEGRYQNIAFVCSILDWPWIRDAYQRNDKAEAEAEPFFAPLEPFDVDPRTLVFLLGELPYITALHERARRALEPAENLAIDGVKQLVLAARDRLRVERPRIASRLTTQRLALYLRYARNLTLIERRLTPDLYTLVVAARQVAGDDFALAIAATAREYDVDDAPPAPADPAETASDREPAADQPSDNFQSLAASWYAADAAAEPDQGVLRMAVGRAEVPGWGVARMTSRLPGPAIVWRSTDLRPSPDPRRKSEWKQRWNPYGSCSWPPEDERIESFHRHVRDQARALLGADLARTEKFTSSVRDGIDLRETLRNWHTGGLYVKVLPPSRGSIDAVVFFFDEPADPRKYVYRSTWSAEHNEESTLAFYATNPLDDCVGPGLARAEYGGALFLYPPRSIPDVWGDRRLDAADTLETRLLAAAMLHARERHVAVVGPAAPSASWRRLARQYGRKLVHVPIKRFGASTLERLRFFHVLNGKHVRSYAADFIRDT